MKVNYFLKRVVFALVFTLFLPLNAQLPSLKTKCFAYLFKQWKLCMENLYTLEDFLRKMKVIPIDLDDEFRDLYLFYTECDNNPGVILLKILLSKKTVKEKQEAINIAQECGFDMSQAFEILNKVGKDIGLKIDGENEEIYTINRRAICIDTSNANINAKNNLSHGWTSLMFYAARGCTEIVRILLCAGADPNIKNVKGQTAMDLALMKNHESIIEMLCTAGVTINHSARSYKIRLRIKNMKDKNQ